jgi:hypothetical protein
MPRADTGSLMNNVIDQSTPPRNSIVWHRQRLPAYCDHQYEVIVHELGAALKRCVRCKRLEAA